MVDVSSAARAAADVALPRSTLNRSTNTMAEVGSASRAAAALPVSTLNRHNDTMVEVTSQHDKIKLYSPVKGDLL